LLARRRRAIDPVLFIEKMQDATLATTKLSKTWCNRLPRREARLRSSIHKQPNKNVGGQRRVLGAGAQSIGHWPRKLGVATFRVLVSLPPETKNHIDPATLVKGICGRPEPPREAA
jgi:hypothetical protein